MKRFLPAIDLPALSLKRLNAASPHPASLSRSGPLFANDVNDQCSIASCIRGRATAAEKS